MSRLRPFIRRSLTPTNRILHLLVLTVPVGVLGVVLKALRVSHLSYSPGPLAAWSTLTSDTAFALGWILLWVVVCRMPRQPASKRLWLLVAHLATAVLAILLVSYHEYQLRTGVALDWQMISVAVLHPGEITGVVGSQMGSSDVTLLVLAVVLSLVFPFWASPRLNAALGQRRWLEQIRYATRHRLRRRALVLIGIGLLVASTWTAPTASARFGRAPLTNLVMAPIDAATAFPVQLNDPVPTHDPNQGSLRPTADEHPNLVVITLESQRATELLPDVGEPITPVLDELRRTSLTATRAYTILPHTSKALVATQCGVEPPFDHQNTESDPDGLYAKCLPEMLSEQGYQTAYFQSATETFERRRKLARAMGYDHFRAVDSMAKSGFSKANYFGFEDDIMLKPSRDWLARNGTRSPFLLTYLTVSAHHDYTLPKLTEKRYVDDPLMNKYLNGVRYQDRFVGKVIQQFKDLGLYDDTVFIIVGDHGEGFGEHGRWSHDNIPNEEGLRIPLLVHDPRSPKAVTVDQPVQQTAILPTAAELLGYRLVDAVQEDRSLLAGGSRGILNFTCIDTGQCVSRLVGDRKYIHFFSDRRDQVFDVVQDPHETRDLIESTDREWVRRQRDEVLRWWLDVDQRYQNVRVAATPSASTTPSGK